MKRLSHFSHETEKLLIPFVLFVYALAHPALLVLVVIAAVRLLRYDTFLFWTFIVCGALHLLMRLSVCALPDTTMHEGVIGEVDVGDYAISATVRTKDGRFRVSGFDGVPSPGQTIAFEGEMRRADAPLFEDGFSYGDYLLSQNIKGMIELESYTTIEGGRSLSSFRHAARRWFERRDADTAFLMRTFILADSSALDSEFKDKARALGVSHLFAVSGMHVAFMAGGLHLFFKNTIGIRPGNVLVCLFLLFYIVLTGGPPSVLRAASMAVLLIVAGRFRLPLSAVDILSMLCIVLLIIRPYSLHDIGFVLSFLVSFTLLLGRDALQGKSKLIQSLNVSLMAFLATLPIIFALQGQANLAGVVYNVVLVWILMVFVLPLTYLTACLPFISPALLGVYGIFESMITLFHDHGMLMLRGHVQSGWLRLIYWALLAWMMAGFDHLPRRLLRMGILGLYMILILFSSYLDPTSRLTMFAVKGDAFLIEDAFSRCNILIDTGDDSSGDALALALSRKGVRHLDYVVITHKHDDHFGGYERVARSQSIGATITPKNAGPYENTMTHCGALRFFMYPAEAKYENENDNSIILWMDTGHARILFTGDMEKSREPAFLRAHGPLPEIDILKAAHHGSNTSSTDKFLEAVDAKEVLVSAHPSNIFNHPGEGAIERFNARGMTIHRTDISGSVEFIDFLGRRYKKTALKD